MGIQVLLVEDHPEHLVESVRDGQHHLLEHAQDVAVLLEGLKLGLHLHQRPFDVLSSQLDDILLSPCWQRIQLGLQQLAVDALI